MNRILRGLWVGSTIAIVGLSAYEWKHHIDPVAHDHYARDIRELSALDAKLNGELMQARQALVTHYDEIVQTSRRIAFLDGKLEHPPSYVAGRERAALLSQVHQLSDTSATKNADLEQFKSENAVLRNSVRYFPVAVEEVRAKLRTRPEADAVVTAINDVLSSVLRFNNHPGSIEEWERAQKAIDALLALRPPAGTEDDVDLIVRHAQTVVDRGLSVDSMTNELLARPTAARILELDTAYDRSFQAAIAGSERRRVALFGLILVGVTLLGVDTILRLRRSASTERKANERLAEANTALVREKERERELNELKSRFVSMTSHEFRTPLSVILSSTELLEAYGEKWKPTKKADHYARIKLAVGGMTELLDGILVIGRAESGKLTCAPTPLDVGRFSRQLIEAFLPTISSKHTFESTIEGDYSDAWADEKLLNHILSNLLSNAVKYSPKGGHVGFSLTREGDEAHFRVSDEGIGIPEDDLERLFESFHRGGNVGHIAGTGLGLAVVKRAIDAHGGEIRIESVAGEGTRIHFSLPLSPPAQADSAVHAAE